MKTDRDRAGLLPAGDGIGVLRDCRFDSLFDLILCEPRGYGELCQTNAAIYRSNTGRPVLGFDGSRLLIAHASTYTIFHGSKQRRREKSWGKRGS